MALALIAGASNLFAFAPFGMWPLQLLSLALVFSLVLRAPSFKASALIGWAFGSGWAAAGIHWLYISMHRYGGMPSLMAIIAVALLALYLGAYTALAFGTASSLQRRFSIRPAVASVMLLPALWVLGDWLRGWVFTGFPWVGTGYAHTASPLAGFAPLIGVYGLSFLAAVMAGCIALLPKSRLPLAGAATLLVLGWGLKSVDWTAPNGNPISVRLLQGNVPQEMKFAPEQIQATLALYYETITSRPADLIATPETAIPLLSSRLPPDYLPLLGAFAQRSNSHIALGIPFSEQPNRYANSMIGLSPANAPAYRYDKHHLVPFGEFIPPGFRWFVNMMNIPLGDFDRGTLVQRPFAVRDQWVLPNICYEDLFGEEIAKQLAAGGQQGIAQATILLNMSNIAWFGDSVALPQHLQISQMRALETGRPMLRATNTGVTGIVDPKGKVQARLAHFERGEIAATVQGYAGLTPYTRTGNLPTIVLALLLLIVACRFGQTSANKPHAENKNR